LIFLDENMDKRVVQPKYFYFFIIFDFIFYYLLTLNVVFKKNAQLNFHQFLKYTI